MNPALLEQLMAVAAELDAAGHGQKSAIYQREAARLGISVATLIRQLKAVRAQPARKRRSDAGESALTQEEARLIAAYLMESSRRNGKRLASIDDAVEVLRANGRIAAGRVDPGTGEFTPLCTESIGRALRRYGVHPDQLSQPTPKGHLRSEHPNHVWQIDPSLCVLYYLPTQAGECLQVMDEKVFYKNKPANIRRIEKERVWRYVITDHTSGVIYVQYVLGAESGRNLVDAFIGASQKRGAADPFHGIPRAVMVDPGSANTGAVFQNLCRVLGVHVDVNLPGQPWAKGQVEKANDIVERSFEHRLRFVSNPPTSLDDINALATRWMCHYNGTQIHSRTGTTRYGAWMRITPDQLIIAPPEQVMRELATAKPEERKVTPFLTVSYRGRTYSVSDIPGVMVGAKLLVTRNPWREDAAQVLYTDENGREVMRIVEAQQHDEFGFALDAATIGKEYKAQPDTVADTERKHIERLITGTDTDKAAAAQRKKKAVAFGGAIDPMKPIDNTPMPEYMPKRGTAIDVPMCHVEQPTLNLVEIAKRLRTRLGDAWDGAAHFQYLAQRYPDGTTEDDLDGIAEALTRQPAAAALRVVNGRGDN